MKYFSLFGLLAAIVLLVFVTTSEAGTCSKSFSLCPSPQRKCISFSGFPNGYQCVANCDECKRILKEKGAMLVINKEILYVGLRDYVGGIHMEVGDLASVNVIHHASLFEEDKDKTTPAELWLIVTDKMTLIAALTRAATGVGHNTCFLSFYHKNVYVTCDFLKKNIVLFLISIRLRTPDLFKTIIESLNDFPLIESLSAVSQQKQQQQPLITSAARRPLLDIGSPRRLVLRPQHPAASCDLHQVVGPPSPYLLVRGRHHSQQQLDLDYLIWFFWLSSCKF